MKMMKRWFALLLVLAMVLSFAGCKRITTEDAEGYLKSVLDVSYKGEFTDYMKYTQSTRAEAEALYTTSLQELMQEAGFYDMGLSADMVTAYEDVFYDLMALANYTILSVQEAGDGFEAEVSYAPFLGMLSLEDELMAVVMERAEEFATLATEEEAVVKTFELMLPILEDMVENPTYGPSETMIVSIYVDSNGLLTVSESDLNELDGLMFPG